MKNKCKNITREQLLFVQKNVKGLLASELTGLFNAEFGTKLTIKQMQAIKKNHHYTSGTCTTFKKGNIPYYKGSIGLAKPNKTSFKKGTKPHNQLPVGDEIVSTSGYLKIKIGDPNHWMFSHRYVYMQAHGDIEKGLKVIFLDQDKYNLKIDNLRCVTSQELHIMNRRQLLFHDKDLSETGVLTAKLIAVTHNIVKEAQSWEINYLI